MSADKNQQAKVSLDEIDLGIIGILLKDGSKNLSEIASIMKVGIATVHRRLKRLKDEGVVEGYTLLVNPKKLGLNVIAVVEMKIDAGSEPMVLKEVEKIEAITEIYKISGQFELSLKIKAFDLDNLNKVLNTIKGINGVQALNTNIVLEVIRDSLIYPIGNGGSG
ncbi:MAG: Lrp/AsnC family transcriptional regulator [Thermoplasmatales archaeon]|jgi:Lrp/AsnC family transcriptional regulator for asnA, asnC and gidA|nr:Lrp/AsnC family transcriptional regulator [Candidatus Thermoplasmatota archaeon]MDA8055385.1 Lrp/AsnC family transcriptional regulator [Thermoplasmatales archaeon]